MNDEQKARRPLALLLFSFAMFPLSLFYLLGVPMLAALAPRENGVGGIAFALFMLAQLAWLGFDMAISVAATFYGFRRRSLLPRVAHALIRPEPEVEPSRGMLVVLMFLSFTLCNYAFAVLYVFLSHVDSEAFSIRTGLSVIDGIYFSVVTAATVGYGDIAPLSPAARLATIVHISLSLIYVVLLFSACATHLRERDNGT